MYNCHLNSLFSSNALNILEYIFCSITAINNVTNSFSACFSLFQVQLGNFEEDVGRVTIIPRVSNPGILVLILILVILFVILVFVFLTFFIRKRKARTGSFTQTAVDDNPAGDVVMFRNGPDMQQQVSIATAPPVPNSEYI